MNIKKYLIKLFVISCFMGLTITNCLSAGLSWEAPSTGTVDGYRVYYGINQTSMSLLQQVDKNTLTISLSSISLEENKTYYFGVKAYNAAGESEFSNIVSYTPKDSTAPFPPTGITVE